MTESPTSLGALTIGHSTHTMERFVGLLQMHGITAIADVRSSPRSQRMPLFNKESIVGPLADAGITYVFLGRELGGRSDDPAFYNNGRIQYSRLASTDRFRSGIDRVRAGAAEFHIALMCAEQEPLACHRALLVAQALTAAGLRLGHIHANGRVETHEDALRRLIRETGLREDLFRNEPELISEAVARRERRIAYVDRRLSVKESAQR